MIEQFNFFNWLSNVKNLVFLNGSKHLRIVIQWHWNSYFSQKITKIAQELGAPPSNPVCNTLSYTSLLNTSPSLPIYTFDLSPLPLAKSW